MARLALQGLALVLMLATACAGSSKSAISANYDPDVARYRLPLRHNPVDPGSAFRCYGSCQELKTSQKYLACLTECPGFEVTQGVACDPADVPPVAACITARRLPNKEEIKPGYLVVAVIANIALIVALGAACTNSSSCGGYYFSPQYANPNAGPGTF